MVMLPAQLPGPAQPSPARIEPCMGSPQAYPIQVLEAHLTTLEAAITVCLAGPKPRPVHKLRTETRRVEALLSLLALVPGLPEHRKQATALLHSLKKLRRAAGEVRDFDVHRKLLKFAGRLPATGDSDPAAKRQNHPRRSPTGEAPSSPAESFSKPAATLRKHLGRHRDKAAASLQELLREQAASIARRAQRLLKALGPAQGLGVAGTDLLRDAEAVLTRDGLLPECKPEDLSHKQLHTLRKAAKAARYIAAALPGDPALVAAAQRFEALQEAGGQWHDALELARISKGHFGKQHELTAAYRLERNRRLRVFQQTLENANAPEAAMASGAALPGKRSARSKASA